MNAPRPPPRLVALSPGGLRSEAEVAAFRRAAGEAFEAGLRGLLVREPELSDRAAFELALSLRSLSESFTDLWLAVHDRLHVALAARADAAHLGFRSLTPRVARSVAKERLALGFSAHAHDSAGAAEGADYLFLGPVLDTPSKRGWVEPLGIGGLCAALASSDRPAWAIGGLRPEHVASVLGAGAAGLAVLSGIFGDPRPGERTRDYLAALG